MLKRGGKTRQEADRDEDSLHKRYHFPQSVVINKTMKRNSLFEAAEVSLYIALLVIFLPLAVYAQPPQPQRIILILCDDLTISDFHSPQAPVLFYCAQRGAIGLMNTSVSGVRSPQSALLTLALGEMRPAFPSDALAFNAVESVPGRLDSAVAIFTRRTGWKPQFDDTLVHIGIASLVRRRLNNRTLGALLSDAKPTIFTSIDGNADTSVPERTASLLTLNSRGMGRGDLDMNQLAPDLPYGVTDANMVTLFQNAVGSNASLFVIRLGDMYRLYSDRSHLTSEEFLKLHSRALRRLDALLYLLTTDTQESNKPDILLVSPLPAPDSSLPSPWGRLTPILAWGPNFPPGLLVSPTTRTAGLTGDIDIAPTLLSLFHTPAPPQMVGRPAISEPDGTGLWRLALLSRMDFVGRINAIAVTRVMIPLGGACFLIAVMAMIARRRKNSVLARRLASVYVFGLNLPSALLLAPLLMPPTLFEYGLRIVFWMGALTAVCYLAERPIHLSPPLIACVFTMVLVSADLLTGQQLIKYSLLCNYAISGIRYYGIGNEYLGVMAGMAIAGGFLWLEKKTAAKVVCLIAGWIWLAFLLGWPWLGANAGSLIVTSAAFGAGGMILAGKSPTFWHVLGFSLAGLALAFAFGALDNHISGSAGSQSGEALHAATHGRGAEYLLEIALRKLAMNIRLLSSPYLWLGAGIVGATMLTASQILNRELSALRQSRSAVMQSVLPLSAALGSSLLFKDSGVVTAAFLCGSASLIILWHLLTEERYN